MGACGVEVLAVVKKVGWNLVPIGYSSNQKEVSCVSLIGFVVVL
jgi:hypothetical protein